MNTPNTELILVRLPRGTENQAKISILKNHGEGFDFSGYSFLRMYPSEVNVMEEWVPTAELGHYAQPN